MRGVSPPDTPKGNDMNLSKKLLTSTAAAVMVAGIGIGSMANADAPATTALPAVDVQAKCDREPEITAKYDATHERLTQRIAHLQERHQKAVDNGRDKLATRLERLITRVQQLDTKLTTRYEKYEAWVDANCQAG